MNDQGLVRACRLFAGFSKLISLMAFCFLLAILPAFAQQSTGTILGVVKDSTGAAMAGANISVTDVDTNETRTAITGNDGSFRVPALQPGHYTVKSEKDGFRTISSTGLVLDVTQELVVNPVMQVGSTTQEVVVTGEAPLVDTTTSSLGGLVNEAKMSDLPLNGRNFVDLEQLQPGVTNNTNYSSGNAQGSNQGTWFSSNGAPLRSNNVMLDGALMINMRGNTASAIGESLGVDGIKEYKVVTTSFSADYGLAMGSQVVIASKGGSNRFSGDVFEYLRNSSLDARNFFDTSYLSTGKRLPQLQKSNFGGAFGGPIKKDKTFFYGVYEGLRMHAGATILDTVFPGGNFASGPGQQNCHLATANPCATKSGGVVAPSIIPLLALYPNPVLNAATNNFTYPAVNPTTADYGQIRVDQNFSDKNSLFGRYTVSNSSNGALATYPQFNYLTVGRDQFLTLAENHIVSSTVLNTVRASYSRTTINPTNQYFQNLIGPQYSFVSGVPIGSISIGTITKFGPTTTAPQLLLQQIGTLSDDIYYTRGRHSLKFGVMFNRFEEDMQISTNAQGAVAFSSVADFLAGNWSTESQLNPGYNENRNISFYTFGFYGQDDWRVNSRLTLNLGLRYEFMTTPADCCGRDYAFRTLLDASTTKGPLMVNPSYKNFSPRVGFAWDVFGTGKTSVRAGFGIYYDLGNMGFVLYNDPQGTPPLSSQSSATNPGGAIFSLPFSFTGTAAPAAIHTMDYNVKQPYTIAENLTIEQKLPFNSAISVSYVGSRGVHLWMAEEGNPCIPTSITNGFPYWAPSGPNPANCPNGRQNTHFGDWLDHDTNGDSSYNSLQLFLTKRVSHGLEFQTSYTWSHLFDTTQGEGGTGECISAGGGNVEYAPDKKHFGRAPACFDAADNLRVNLLYHVPDIKTDNIVGRALLHGWWTGTILSWQTGFPFTPMVSTYRSLSGNLTSQTSNSQPDHANIGTASVTSVIGGNTYNFIPYDKSKVITGNPNQWFNPLMFVPGPIGYLGTASRDMLRGPHLSELDLSLNKDTALPVLGENGKLQFRFELFNLLNHANFGMPNGFAYAGGYANTTGYLEAPAKSAGLINNTITTSRQIQLALRFVF